MSHVESNLKTAVASARAGLRNVIVPLQERAMRTTAGQKSEKILGLAERTAAVMSQLFDIEKRGGDDKDWLAGQLTSIMEELRGVLTDAQLTFAHDEEMAAVVASLASSLATVFALASAYNPLRDRVTEPPPERVSTAPTSERASRVKRRLQLVVEPSDPPPPAAPQQSEPPPESIPLVRRSIPQPAPSSEPPSAPSPQPAAEAPPAPPPSTPSSPPSRRKAERVQLEADIGFVSETHFYTGITMDISTGGLFLATYQLLAVGTEVDLSLVLPGGYAIQTPGVVKWIRDTTDVDDDSVPGMGIQFVSLTEEDKEQIERFCRLRAPLYYDEED